MKADDEFNYYMYGMDREVYKCIVLSNNLVEKVELDLGISGFNMFH